MDPASAEGSLPCGARCLLLSASPEGRDYIIRVPGVAQSPLSDEETAALLNWMARNLSDSAAAPNYVEFSAAEVQRSRPHPFARVRETRSRLLKDSPAP